MICISVVIGAVSTLAETLPGLGESVPQELLEAIDYTVLPDGEGLPAGSGTVTAGTVIYRPHCLACPGEKGQGGPNDQIAGGLGSIDTDAPVKTVGSYWPFSTTLFDYIRRAMPYQTPGSLTADQIYSVTAYVLFLNGIVEEQAQIDARLLPGIQMPNRHGFVWAVPGD